jgi:hypothetical protein
MERFSEDVLRPTSLFTEAKHINFLRSKLPISSTMHKDFKSLEEYLREYFAYWFTSYFYLFVLLTFLFFVLCFAEPMIPLTGL